MIFVFVHSDISSRVICQPCPLFCNFPQSLFHVFFPFFFQIMPIESRDGNWVSGFCFRHDWKKSTFGVLIGCSFAREVESVFWFLSLSLSDLENREDSLHALNFQARWRKRPHHSSRWQSSGLLPFASPAKRSNFWPGVASVHVLPDPEPLPQQQIGYLKNSLIVSESWWQISSFRIWSIVTNCFLIVMKCKAEDRTVQSAIDKFNGWYFSLGCYMWLLNCFCSLWFIFFILGFNFCFI